MYGSVGGSWVCIKASSVFHVKKKAMYLFNEGRWHCFIYSMAKKYVLVISTVYILQFPD